MDIGIGLPVHDRGHHAGAVAGRGSRRAEAQEFSTRRHDRPHRLRQLRAADRAGGRRRGHRADPARHLDPDRPVSRQRGARGQAGGIARPALERPAGPRRRGRRARGRLRGLGRRLPLARGRHGRDARAVAADLGRRVVRLAGAIGPQPPRGRPTLLDRRRRGCRLPARRASTATAGSWAAGRPTCSARAAEQARAAWRAAGRDGEPRTMALAYFALGDGAEEAANALPPRLLRVPRRLRRHDRRQRRRPTRTPRGSTRRASPRRAATSCCSCRAARTPGRSTCWPAPCARSRACSRP